METRKITCTILKKGRKWYKAKLKDKNYEVNVSMDNCILEENKEYTFTARVDIDRTKYGVKTYIYPISKEVYEDEQNKEKESKLIKNFNQYFNYCKEADYVYTNGFKKLEDILCNLKQLTDVSEYINKVDNLKTEKTILQLKNNLYKKLSQIKDSNNIYKEGITTCNTIIKELKCKFELDTEKFELKLNDIVKTKMEELEEKQEYQHKQYIKSSIDNGLIIDISDMNDEDILSKYKNRFKDVPAAEYDGYLRECFDIVDISKYIDVILNRLRIDMDERELYKNLFIDNIPKIYKTTDNKIYILTISLSSNIFKHFIKNNYITELNNFYNDILNSIDKDKDNRHMTAFFPHTLHGNEYICTNPDLLVKQLYSDGILKNINNLTSEEDKDITFIKITLDAPLEKNTWDYRKDTVYNELYYIVREVKQNNKGSYYAYYILGQDHDTKKGFAHRLPWKEEGYYEKMSVKEILDDTFYYNQDYNRIQGDIVYKEISVSKDKIRNTKTFQGSITKISLENNIILNIVNNINTTICKYFNDTLEDKKEVNEYENDFITTEFNIRKNFKILGEFYNKFLHEDIYRNSLGDVYPWFVNITESYFSFKDVEYIKNNKHYSIPAKPNSIIIISHKDNIEDMENWTKLNYGYFYKYLSIQDSKNVKFEEISTITDYEEYYIDKMPISSMSTIFRKFTNKSQNLGLNNLSNHVVDGDIKYYSNNILIVKGPFTITHHQHHKVSAGKDDSYYIIRNAKRHRTSNVNIIRD